MLVIVKLVGTFTSGNLGATMSTNRKQSRNNSHDAFGQLRLKGWNSEEIERFLEAYRRWHHPRRREHFDEFLREFNLLIGGLLANQKKLTTLLKKRRSVLAFISPQLAHGLGRSLRRDDLLGEFFPKSHQWTDPVPGSPRT
jgi:hypothetical protein